MKKRLLLAGLLFGTFLNASAQETISFETSEGFQAGSINGQNGWAVTAVDETGTTFVANQDITTAQANDGTNSLQITADTQFQPLNNTIVGASRTLNNITGQQVEVSFDIYIDEDDDAATDGADYDFYAVSLGEELVTARLKFFYAGNIVVLDAVPEAEGGIDFVDTGLTWTADTWYTVRVAMDFATEKISYYINDELAYEGSVFAGTTIDQIAFRNDNYPGNTAYIDNVVVPTGSLSVKNIASTTEFSVYPNPATNVVNVGGTDALVNNVSIVDLNGRTVKTAKFNGVANAEVNVADLSAGVYMMTVASDKGTVTKKIVKN